MGEPIFFRRRCAKCFLAVVLVVGGLGIDKVQSQEKSANSAVPTNAWTAPTRAARKENPVASDAKSIAQGKELYVANCLVCHGATGIGDGSAAGTLERNGVQIRVGNLADPKLRQQTDGELFWKMTQGNTPMPAWGETLSDEQRWAIINYIRRLPPQTNAAVIAQQPKKKVDYE